MTNPRPHVLYRFYDADGDLLYVGITMDPAARWRQHRDEKPWWFEVARIGLTTYPDRAAVLLAERDAIETESPRYNVVHNRGLRPVRTAPSERSWGRVAEDMGDCCRECRNRGTYAVYYPHRWWSDRPDGCLADYACEHGHSWTCGWGHGHAGTAPEHYGRPALVAS